MKLTQLLLTKSDSGWSLLVEAAMQLKIADFNGLLRMSRLMRSIDESV